MRGFEGISHSYVRSCVFVACMFSRARENGAWNPLHLGFKGSMSDKTRLFGDHGSSDKTLNSNFRV